MEFRKFNSLENTYKQNLIDKVQYEGKDTGKWIATEKLHGANFSFWCDGNEVKVASRTQFVDGTFFNCQAVINKYSPCILQMYNTMGVGKILIVYGELFGGNIQKEVEYGEKDFNAFDIVWDSKPMNKQHAFFWCTSFGIPVVPVKMVASFRECMGINNNFQSDRTPKDYKEDNLTEGLVIEPVEPSWFNNDSRIYFKYKTEGFSEKKRIHREKIVFELSETESELMNGLLEYNTTQRVANVISKVGEVNNKMFGRILGLTTQDLLEEFTNDTEIDPKVVAEDNWKQFIKLLQAEVGKTVREQFLLVVE